jgi:hypothetical protein
VEVVPLHGGEVEVLEDLPAVEAGVHGGGAVQEVTRDLSKQPAR